MAETKYISSVKMDVGPEQDSIIYKVKDAEARVMLIEGQNKLADAFNALNTKLEGVTINGVELANVNNIIDIPVALNNRFGVVKLGEEFSTDAETGSLEINKVNINKLEQSEGDVLVLDGGLASNLIARQK